MKKIYTLAFSILTTLFANAQYQLTSVNAAPQAGDFYNYEALDTTGLKAGPGGAAVTWDFSSATIGTSKSTQSYIAASGTTYASNYPTATVAIQSSSTAFAYYSVTTGGFYNVGSQSSATSRTIFSDDLLLQKFPFDYTNTFSDVYKGHNAGGGIPDSIFGTTSGVADGYGTLKLPGGIIYNNAMRVVVTQNDIDSLLGFVGLHFSYKTYYWYVVTQRNPVFYIQYFSTYTSQTPNTVNKNKTVVMSYTPSAVEELNENAIQSLVYPNPVNTGGAVVSFNLKNDGATTIAVVNTLGQSVISLNKGNLSVGSYTEQVDVSGLEKGIYFIKIQSGINATSSKLIVQ